MPAFEKGQVWSTIEKIIPHVSRILLYGPSGTGKTHVATIGQMAANEEIFQITLTPDTAAAALIGHFIVKNKGCVWLDGVGVAAWRASHDHPTRLVINEVDHAGPDAISALHLLLDDISTAGMRLPTGKDVKPGKKLKIIGTMNGVPTDLLPSLQDRFPFAIHVDEVSPGAVESLPTDLRTAAMNSAIHKDPARRSSIRAWQAYANLRGATEEETAARCVFGERWHDILDGIKVATAAK